MSDIKLKPCPFCGGQAEIVERSYGVVAQCMGRNVYKDEKHRDTQCPVSARTRSGQDRTGAARQWNTRHAEA